MCFKNWPDGLLALPVLTSTSFSRETSHHQDEVREAIAARTRSPTYQELPPSLGNLTARTALSPPCPKPSRLPSSVCSLVALEAAVNPDQMLELARAFGISTGEVLAMGAGEVLLQGPRSMAPMIASVFRMELHSAIRREQISLRMAGEIAARQSENVGREFAPVHRGLLTDLADGLAIS